MEQESYSIPYGKLGIIALKGITELGKKVDNYLVQWRAEKDIIDGHLFSGYSKDSFLIDSECPRFGSGEAKGIINESVRGCDLYILVDVCNYSCEYNLYGRVSPMSPDDHFQDLKRVIAAVGGKARRINVIMPWLYEGRQHKRTARESLDCATALKELEQLGIVNIITFDAHDPRVQNAIPLTGFENVQPTYQIIKALVNSEPDIDIERDKMMIISPDEGGMTRCVYYASVMGLDLGMFYKRRDYTRIENGRNPIIAHEYLGDDVEGKDILIVDDIISSGESMLDVASELKRKKARNIYVAACFGMFTDGLEEFDKAVSKGIIKRVFTTNVSYRSPELLERHWYKEVDMSKYIAYIIDNLNHDKSLSTLLNPTTRISSILARHKESKTNK